MALGTDGLKAHGWLVSLIESVGMKRLRIHWRAGYDCGKSAGMRTEVLVAARASAPWKKPVRKARGSATPEFSTGVLGDFLTSIESAPGEGRAGRVMQRRLLERQGVPLTS